MEIASGENRSLTVVIPARNEAPHLADIVRETARVCPGAEIIVVDDGSTDNTGALAAAAGARVIRHPYSLGNGASVRRGIRAATGDWVLILDGDGQHPPAEIPKLLKDSELYALTVAERPLASQAFLRSFGNRVFNALASYVSEIPVTDLTSGMRLYRRAAILPLLPLFPNGFSSPATGTLGILRSGYPIRFVPIEPGKGHRPSHLNPWADGSKFLLIIFRIATLYSPLKVFLPLSFVLFFAGGVYLGFNLVENRTFPPAALFTLTSALLVFVLGLISEQISQIRFSKSFDDEESYVRNSHREDDRRE